MMKFEKGPADINSANKICSLANMSSAAKAATVRLDAQQIKNMTGTLKCLPTKYVDQCFDATPTDSISADMYVRKPLVKSGVEWTLIYKLRSGNAECDVLPDIHKCDEVVKCDVIGLSADYSLSASGYLQQLHSGSAFQYNVPLKYAAMRDGMNAGQVYSDQCLSKDAFTFINDLEKTFFDGITNH